MLHILLLILKIIGAVLLVVLGLLLLAVLLVLLVPLRYSVKGGYHEAPSGQVRVTWLLRAVSLLVSYDKELSVTAKILGFCVFQTDQKGVEEEEDRPDENGGAAEESRSAGTDSAVWDGASGPAAQEAPTGGTAEGPAAGNGPPDGAAAAAGENSGADGTDSSGGGAEALSGSDGAGKGYSGGGAEAGSSASKAQLDSSGGGAGSSSLADEAEPLLASGEAGTDISQLPTVDEMAGEEEESSVPDSENIFEKMQYLYLQICDKLGWADEKRRWGLKFIRDPRNQKTFRLLWRQVKRLLHHLLPTKASGDVTFGFDDPATTGEVLAACSLLYAMYGPKLTITPDFENAVIEGDMDVKGRIRLGTVAAIIIRVLADRNFWRMIRQLRRFAAGLNYVPADKRSAAQVKDTE